MIRITRCKFQTNLSICFLLLSGALCLLSGCEKDDDPPAPLPDYEITISDIEGIPAGVTFNKVTAEISGFEWDIIETVEAPYADGKAVLSIPAEFEAEKLCKVVRDKVDDYTGFWHAKTNNTDARVAGLGDFFAYYNGEKVGRIYRTDWEGTGPAEYKSFIYYHYADSPFTLSGHNNSFRFEASFKKGWNIYANIKAKEKDDSGLNLCTTTIPNEAQTVWRFESFKY